MASTTFQWNPRKGKITLFTFITKPSASLKRLLNVSTTSKVKIAIPDPPMAIIIISDKERRATVSDKRGFHGSVTPQNVSRHFWPSSFSETQWFVGTILLLDEIVRFMIEAVVKFIVSFNIFLTSFKNNDKIILWGLLGLKVHWKSLK